ncbi:MAG: ATP-binding protein [Bacteroidota bacterium]
MKLNSPRSIALFLALILACLSIFLVLLFTQSFSAEKIWLLVFAFLLSFGIGFLIIFSLFRRFISKRINVLYRTIHNLKISGQNKIDIDLGEDVFEKVDEDIKDWAQDKIGEIRQLKEQDNFRRDFIGNLAHELKTPLFSIQGYILSLHEGAAEDPKVRSRFIKNAAKNVERMTRIVEDLDTISHFESNRLELEIDRADIVQSARSVIDELEDLAQKKDISLSFNKKYDAELFVMMDEFRISQVIANLVKNSIAYGRKGGSTVIRFHDMNERILVEVADDGPGIEEKHLPRLFERFYRVDASRSRHEGGTGLGLAIVKHIVEAHEQSINARSTVGIGSTFSFTLAKA